MPIANSYKNKMGSEKNIPKDLGKALSASPKGKSLWNELTPIARRDFLRWIEGAKQEETRARRIERTCSMLAKGKKRPCCYAVVPMNLYKALGANPKAKATWHILTPDERRDFVDWVDEAKQKELNKKRIDEVLRTLAAGKRRP